MRTYIYSGETFIVRTRFDDDGRLVEAEILYDENAIEIEEDLGERDVEEESEIIIDTPPDRVVTPKAFAPAANTKAKLSSDQIAGALRRLENGEKITAVAQDLGISTATVYNWKNKRDGLNAEEKKYHSFKAPISEKQFKEIRLQKIEEIPMADVADEFNVTEAVVERAWSVMTYDNYLREERKSAA